MSCLPVLHHTLMIVCTWYQRSKPKCKQLLSSGNSCLLIESIDEGENRFNQSYKQQHVRGIYQNSTTKTFNIIQIYTHTNRYIYIYVCIGNVFSVSNDLKS